jgi:hypothetical protein
MPAATHEHMKPMPESGAKSPRVRTDNSRCKLWRLTTCSVTHASSTFTARHPTPWPLLRPKGKEDPVSAANAAPASDHPLQPICKYSGAKGKEGAGPAATAIHVSDHYMQQHRKSFDPMGKEDTGLATTAAHASDHSMQRGAKCFHPMGKVGPGPAATAAQSSDH